MMLSPALWAGGYQKQWSELIVTGPWHDTQHIRYIMNSSLRFIDEHHGFEIGLIGYGLGYQYRPHIGFWLGYQWNSRNQINGHRQEDRIWQQIIWDAHRFNRYVFTTRTRLEERFRNSAPGTSYRLRERVALQCAKHTPGRVCAVTRDELFVNLNHPQWVNRQSINQNRYFVGMDIYAKHHLFEFGYLNQYTLSNTHHNMDHVLYLGITINT